MLGHINGDLEKFERYINVQKPVCNLVDKITSNGQFTGDKHTAGQEKRVNATLNNNKSIFKILAIKYTLPDEFKNRLKFIKGEQQRDGKLKKISDEIRIQDNPKYKIDKNVLYKIIDGQWKIMVKDDLVEEMCIRDRGYVNTGIYKLYGI